MDHQRPLHLHDKDNKNTARENKSHLDKDHKNTAKENKNHLDKVNKNTASKNSSKDKNTCHSPVAATASSSTSFIRNAPDRFSFRGAVEKGSRKGFSSGGGGGGGDAAGGQTRGRRRGLSLSLKRSNFWQALHSKTMEIPDKLRKDERKLTRVPRLQIWLSTDQSSREQPPEEHQVLNNTRDPIPKLHLDQPRGIYRSASESAKWRIVVDGASPPPPRDGAHANYDSTNERPKSPVEKQPTWPITFPHVLASRPRLTHQDNIQLQLLHQHHQQQQQQQRSVEGERRLPRQDAVAEEVDMKETDPLKGDEINREPAEIISIVDQPPAHTPPASNPSARPLRPRLLKAPNCLGVGNFWPRRYSVSSRSCSDEKSDGSEFSRSDSLPSENGGKGEVATLSVNSIYTESGGSAVSPNSSRLSLRSELSRTHSLSHPHTHYPRSRANTADNSNAHPQRNRPTTSSFRLQIPGQESQRSRRPSLLSLRSLARSLNPYFSIDYDYDSFDYDPYQAAVGGGPGGMPYPTYLPHEPVPKLSFTQKLAFPTLVQNSIDRPKPRDPYMEAEHNMNTFAKIITIVVLALVTVLVLGVLYKLLQ